MSCACGTVKYTLFLFNTLWAVLGLLAITFAAFGWDAMPQIYAIGLVVMGFVIISVAFFGCTGAMRESPKILWTFVAISLMLLVLIIVFMCFNTRDVFKKYALKNVDYNWKMETSGKEGSMDDIQATYFCCGRNSTSDYFDLDRSTVPVSCCKNKDCFNVLNVYVAGCAEKVEEAFLDEAKITQIYEWLIFGTDLTIFVLSVILAIHYTNRRRRFNY